jgi:hypothetical protein
MTALEKMQNPLKSGLSLAEKPNPVDAKADDRHPQEWRLNVDSNEAAGGKSILLSHSCGS